MKIDVITIFPNLFNDFINTSIIKIAISKGLLEINLVDLRKYSHNKHHKIDDTIYGGAPGMLMAFPPLYDAIMDLKKENTKVIYLSPQGKVLKQRKANTLAKLDHIIILCGHYEGVDARILNFIDYEISIGDYVLTGGELPAIVLIDSITRLIPNVITEESIKTDSLYNGLLKAPEYTKPSEYKGYKVPDILLSGDHEKIRKYNEEQALLNTKNKRKDLIKK